MAGLPDRTDAAPVRRMSVARGTLRIPGGSSVEGVDDRLRGIVEAAVVSAVKRSPELLPAQQPVQATHVDVLCTPAQDACTLTVTVQAYAREHLDSVALFGVMTGLLVLRQALGGELEALGLVQNVVS